MFLFLRKSHMHTIIELLRHLYIHNLPSSLSYCTLPLVCTTAAVYYTYHKQFCESLTYQSYSQWLGNANKGANLDEIETKFFQLTTPFLTTLLSTITMNLIPREWRTTRVCVCACVCVCAVLHHRCHCDRPFVESMFAHQRRAWLWEGRDFSVR